MYITIRQATHDDIEILTDLLEELFFIEADFEIDSQKQYHGLEQMFTQETSVIWVAEHEACVVGMCTLQKMISTSEGGAVGLVEDVIVQKKYRNKGIGKRLIQTIEDYAIQERLLRLQLLADSRNQNALDFYSRAKWQKTQLVCLRKTF